jgi:hypothetical protein
VPELKIFIKIHPEQKLKNLLYWALGRGFCDFMPVISWTIECKNVKTACVVVAQMLPPTGRLGLPLSINK